MKNVDNSKILLSNPFRRAVIRGILSLMILAIFSCGDNLLNTEITASNENENFKLTLKVDPDIVYLNSSTKVTVIIERLTESSTTPSSLQLDAVGGKLDGSGLIFDGSYSTGTVVTVSNNLDSGINSKFEVLAFFVPTYSYSSTYGYTGYMENGHVTAKYNNINVTLPIQMATPRQK